jgi:hypothetical protein
MQARIWMPCVNIVAKYSCAEGSQLYTENTSHSHTGPFAPTDVCNLIDINQAVCEESGICARVSTVNAFALPCVKASHLQFYLASWSHVCKIVRTTSEKAAILVWAAV